MEPGNYRGALHEAAAAVSARIGAVPRVVVVTGTGLGAPLTAAMAVCGALPYAQIPHFPAATVPGHGGRLVWGELSGVPLLVLDGRFHLYEGYSGAELVFPVRVLAACGVRTLLATNAAGALNPAYAAGDLMLVSDHINLTGVNPLAGAHDPEWGPRFPDMSAAYDAGLRALARETAAAQGQRLHEGVYVAVHGPSLETPAETRFFRAAGADAIGMSTVPEVIAAVQAGVHVLAVSVITNVNDPDHMAPTSLDAVIRAATAAAPRLRRLIEGVLARLPRNGEA